MSVDRLRPDYLDGWSAGKTIVDRPSFDVVSLDPLSGTGRPDGVTTVARPSGVVRTTLPGVLPRA